MFPDTDFNIENEVVEEKKSLGKVYLFDFDTNKYILEDGKLVETTKNEAIRKYAAWTIKTILGKYAIYQDDYGIDFSFRFTKLPTGFVESELRRQIKEQLTKHILVNDVVDFKTTRESSKLIMSFTLVTTENENIILNESLVII